SRTCSVPCEASFSPRKPASDTRPSMNPHDSSRHPELRPRMSLLQLKREAVPPTILTQRHARFQTVARGSWPPGTDHEIRADFDREAGATCGGWARFRLPGASNQTARHAGECAE